MAGFEAAAELPLFFERPDFFENRGDLSIAAALA
jgi:hypothetical protein